MAAHEQLILDILANTSNAERGIGSLAKTIGAADDDVAGLARRLDELGKKNAQARVGLQGNTEANAQLDKLDAKMIAIGRRVMDPNIKVDGVARASLDLAGISAEIDKVGKSGEKAAGPGGGLAALASSSGGGMGALIAAGAVLSPVLVTLGVGLGGLALAAYGASKNTKLMSQELAPAKAELAAFSKQLQPEVIGAFNQGLSIAGHLLHDIEPVAAATGKAFDGFLGRVDAEFQSGVWQSFFGFMAANAAPDMKVLGNLFINLLDTLPPLLRNLQPLATALLNDAAGAAKLVDDGSQLVGLFNRLSAAADSNQQKTSLAGKVWGILANAVKQAGGQLVPVLPPLAGIGHELGIIGSSGVKAAGSTKSYGGAVDTAGAKVWTLTVALTALNTAMAKNDAHLFTLQGDTIAWRQSLQAAATQLNSNSKGLDGNSAKALANKAAVLASSQAAQTLAEKQLTMRNGMAKASTTIQAQITWLQQHGDKSKFAAAEIQALRDEEAKIQAQINSQINVTGSGRWNVVQAGRVGPQRGKSFTQGQLAAEGWRVPGYGGGDKWPAMLEGGEAVVPKHLTPVVAPFLAAHKVPGFASGGVMGSVAGLTGQISSQMYDTVFALESATAAAIFAAMKSAAAAAQTFGGGLGRASLRQIEDWWIGAGGPGGGTAHVAAAITGAESGFNPRAVQQGQPYATTGWGLWQITPGNSEPQAGINQQLLNGPANAIAAVAKYRGAGGFSPWTTFEDGAYLQFMDHGGWLPPGPSLVVNNTGQPEQVLPPGRPASVSLTQHGDVHINTPANATLVQQQLSVAITRSGLGR